MQAVEAVIETFGPFLIPVALFVVGAIGYSVFVLLTRQEVLPYEDETDLGDRDGDRNSDSEAKKTDTGGKNE